MKSLLQKYRWMLSALAAIFCLANASTAAFYGDPPDTHNPWAVHDNNRPQPPRVEPATIPNGAPSDAVVLFDGTEASLENWFHVNPVDKRKGDWIVKDGALQCVPGAGYIASIEEFGDCQLHVEWLAPSEIKGNGQGRGNSGVFLMGMVEVQVLDNYQNPTYSDGTAGAVYGVMPPAANSLRGPGEWQSYDIIFRRPIVRDSVVIDEGSITVLVNGVVVQDSTPLEGGGGWKKRQSLNRVFPEKGSLRLQDHGNPVRYRNIWYRPLRPRPVDGGTDGRLSKEASLVKRAEIASEIRLDAATLVGLHKALRLLESLQYAEDETARAQADTWITEYVVKLKSLSPKQLETEKDSVISLDRSLQYMSRYELIDSDYAASTYLSDLAIEQAWKKAPK